MKEKICFRKYRNYSIAYGVVTLLLLSFTILMKVNDIPKYDIVGVIFTVIFGVLACCYVYSYLYYKKKTKNMAVHKGTIINWQIAGYRGRTGCVILKHEEKQYSSPCYFNHQEASEMVGKEVTYIIFNDILLIYDILN